MNDTANNVKNQRERMEKLINRDGKVVANNELATPKSGIDVYITSSATEPRNVHREMPKNQESQVVTDVNLDIKGKNGKVVNRKLSGKQAKLLLKNKLIGIKKKLKNVFIVGLIAAAVGAGIYAYNKNNENVNTVDNQETPAVVTVDKAHVNGGWEAKVNDYDTLYNQALAQGIEIYNKTGQQISGEDLIKMYIGSNSEYISVQLLAELGLSDTVTPTDITSAVQNYSAINKEASDAGVVIDQFILSKTHDDNAVEATTKANTKYATTGNFDAAKTEINKYDMATYSNISNAGQTYIANFAYNGEKDFATIVLGASNAACQNMHEGESKYDNYLNNIKENMKSKFDAAQSKDVIVTEDMNYLNIAAKLDKELTAHTLVHPYTGKTMIELKNELLQNTINKDAKEIAPSEDLDEAIKQNPGGKIDTEKKTYNPNPNNVVDKTKETSTPKVEYKDNNGKTTTKEEVTKEDVKTGETTIINGKEYIKNSDGTYTEVNKNAGKGVQVQEEKTIQTEEKVVETKTETEVKVETKTESEAKTDTNTNTNNSIGNNVVVTEQFEVDGVLYDSIEDYEASISHKTR